MKALFWKEWRENGKWAALAGLALALAEFCGLQAGGHRESVLNTGFYLITVFGNAAVGLLFGLIQFIPERGRDRWAALFHRPVPRIELFLGKAAAGLTLYLAATAAPFLLASLYAALPGRFAFPLSPAMLVPGLADIGTGGAYYFLGAFLVVDQGRWFLRRILAVLAALAVSVLMLAPLSIGWLLTWAAVAVAVSALAAWGAVTTNGLFSTRPLAARAALLGVLLVGLYAAFGVVEGLRQIFVPSRGPSWSEYRIDASGSPFRVSHGRRSVEIFDLAGHSVSNPHYDDAPSEGYLARPDLVSSWIGDANGRDDSWMDFGARSERAYALSYVVGRDDDPLATVWYYLRDRRYFIGYSLLSRRPNGILDREGFHPPTALPSPFPGGLKGFESGRNNQLAAYAGSTLYFFDLKGHGMRTAPMPGSIFGLGTLAAPTDRERNWFAVALAGEMRVVDGEGADIARLAYRRDVGTRGRLSAGTDRARSRFFLLYDPSGWIIDRSPGHFDSFLEVADARGVPVRSEVLPSLRRDDAGMPFWLKVQNALGLPPVFDPFVVAGEFASAKERDARRGRPAVWTGQEWKSEAAAFAWGEAARFGAWALGAALLCAGGALTIARRRAFSRRQAGAWAIFVLAFNLPGLIVFLLAADWPVLAKCPACGKPRRVDEETCPHCAAAWPAPERDGTEIFDAAGRPEAARSALS